MKCPKESMFLRVLPELRDIRLRIEAMADGRKIQDDSSHRNQSIDNEARCVRAIRGTRNQAAGWQLQDDTTAGAPPLGGEVEFPLTINSQDAKGNILKMRVQFGVPKPEPLSTILTIDQTAQWLHMSTEPPNFRLHRVQIGLQTIHILPLHRLRAEVWFGLSLTNNRRALATASKKCYRPVALLAS